MIISRTPFRVSLFGGGTDYPDWFLENGGSVIGMTIDKYCYLSVRYLPPFFKHKHRIVWSRIELVDDINEIEHPAVRTILKEKQFNTGLEIAYNADLPARSGLGTSSSFSVGLINALNALNGQMSSKKELADEAIRIEQEIMLESVGSQDQVWAAYGGFNRISFNSDGSYEVSPILVTKKQRKELLGSFMLFFTGFSRYSGKLAERQIANFKNKNKELNLINDFTNDATKILQENTGIVTNLGHLMHEGWQIKRELAEGVSTPEIDEIYDAGIEAGATGGKLLGAGGGGFMLFIVQPENQTAVRNRLKKFIHVDFDLESDGSKIIVFDPNDVV
ncbi:MAG: kinase [Rhodospirillaceae bacterium]|nr:kinase [Rhodospirillaceae bacterium]OUT76690.1 MAG: kinase [Rhodospirillaceae bacterium TMED23]|tara:strand:+ start:3425 stop:4423 length:999 start_codon:yes stop_codon:yes gene_type:complete